MKKLQEAVNSQTLCLWTCTVLAGDWTHFPGSTEEADTVEVQALLGVNIIHSSGPWPLPEMFWVFFSWWVIICLGIFQWCSWVGNFYCIPSVSWVEITLCSGSELKLRLMMLFSSKCLQRHLSKKVVWSDFRAEISSWQRCGVEQDCRHSGGLAVQVGSWQAQPRDRQWDKGEFTDFWNLEDETKLKFNNRLYIIDNRTEA